MYELICMRLLFYKNAKKPEGPIKRALPGAGLLRETPDQPTVGVSVTVSTGV